MASRVYPVKGHWVRDDLLCLVDQAPKRVLSLGCGTADTECELKRRFGSEVWGVDFVADSLLRAGQRIDRVIRADLEQDALDEIPDRYFDLVLCADVLEHLRFPEALLVRAVHWLRPGGQLLVSVPNSAHYRCLRQLVWERDWRYTDGGLFDRGHYRIFTRKSALRLLRDTGFHVQHISHNRDFTGKSALIAPVLRQVARILPLMDDYLAQQWVLRAVIR